MAALASLFLLGLIATLAFCPNIIDAATAPRWAVLAAGIPICFMLQPPAERPLGSTLPIWSYALALAIVTIFWSSDWLGGVHEAIQLAILFSAFCLGATVRRAQPLWVGIECGVAVCAVIVVAQSLGWNGLPQSVTPGGLFMNKNAMAEIALVAAVTSFMAGAWWLFAAAMIVMALTASKAALGALIVAGAFYLAPRAPRIAMGIMVVMACALVAAFSGAAPSAAVRLEFWGAILSDLRLFGHGLGSYASDNLFAEFAHSEPLQALYELGIFMLPLLAIILYAAGARYEAPTEWIVLVALGVVSAFAFPFHLPATALAAAFAAGHLVGCRDRVRCGALDGRVPLGVGA